MWKPLTTAFENVVADRKTTAPVRAKVQGILKKLQSYRFLCLVCCYLDVLELITPASKMFEEGELMPYEVKPIIQETILNLNDTIESDTDEDMLTSHLASFRIGDNSIITTECFNADDVHKLIKDRRLIQVELVGMKFVEENSYQVAIREKKKVCDKLKDVIDTKYKDFDKQVFQNMKWFNPETWGNQEVAQITGFYEHFKEPLDHVNFSLNFCLKEFKKFKNYVHVNHEGKKARDIWKDFLKTRRLEYPNLALIAELMMCLSCSNSSVERAFNLLTMLLSDQRLNTSHDTINAILNININDKVFSEGEKNEILKEAVESFMEKRRTAVFEDSNISQEERVTEEDSVGIYEEEDSEEEWDQYVYENVRQNSIDISETDNEMESDNEQADSFYNDSNMWDESNQIDADEYEGFNPLDYNV